MFPVHEALTVRESLRQASIMLTESQGRALGVNLTGSQTVAYSSLARLGSMRVLQRLETVPMPLRCGQLPSPGVVRRPEYITTISADQRCPSPFLASSPRAVSCVRRRKLVGADGQGHVCRRAVVVFGESVYDGEKFWFKDL